MKYRISRRADKEIKRVCNRIAKENPEAAIRLNDQLHRAIKLLAKFPRMGHTRADVDDERYRFRVIGSYVVAYRVEDAELVVVRVVHGARDFRELFRRG